MEKITLIGQFDICFEISLEKVDCGGSEKTRTSSLSNNKFTIRMTHTFSFIFNHLSKFCHCTETFWHMEVYWSFQIPKKNIKKRWKKLFFKKTAIHLQW